MFYIIENNDKKEIHLQKKPFAKGGQGEVFNIINYKNKVAKIFNFKEESEKIRTEAKINFMLKNCPTKNSSQEVKDAIVWPENLIYDKNQSFVGYIMPFVEDSNPLEHLCDKEPQKKLGNAWQKFDVTNGDLIRKKILCNLSNAISELHRTGNYVLVDMKPDNILINQKGKVSIIDLDSIQIAEKKSLVFEAEAYTSDYSPPERKNFDGKAKLKNWDYFSFGIIAYKILLCVHPFSSGHSDYNTIEDFIENGKFVNGKNKLNFDVISEPHSKFKFLENELREYFIRCFDNGFIDPSKRPNFKEWSNLFSIIINRNEVSQKEQCTILSKTPKSTQKVKYSNQSVKTPIKKPIQAPVQNISKTKSKPKVPTQILKNISKTKSKPKVTTQKPKNIQLNNTIKLSNPIRLFNNIKLNRLLILQKNMKINSHLNLANNISQNNHIDINAHINLNKPIALN